jgi:hypothetical protein
MFMQESFCWVALVLLTAGAFSTSSFAVPTVVQDNSNQSRTESEKRLRNPSPRREVASSRVSKHGQRTIIFVGGKKGSQGAVTKSDPTAARKSNGTLNPQPIPPGKQRKAG